VRRGAQTQRGPPPAFVVVRKDPKLQVTHDVDVCYQINPRNGGTREATTKGRVSLDINDDEWTDREEDHRAFIP